LFCRLILCIRRHRFRRSRFWWQVGRNRCLVLHCLLQLRRLFLVDLLPPALHPSLTKRLFYLWLYRGTMLQCWRWGHYFQLTTSWVDPEAPLIFRNVTQFERQALFAPIIISAYLTNLPSICSLSP